MSLLASATFDLSGATYAPNYIVTISGLSGVPGASTIKVIRTYSDQTSQTVRGLDMLPITGDSATASDYEASFIHGDWQYDFHIYNAAGVELTSIVGIAGGDPDSVIEALRDEFPDAPYWLVTSVIKSVQQPVLNIGAVVQDFPTWDIPGRVLATLNVLGRSNPIVINDAFGGRTGTFTLLQDFDLDSQFYRDFEALLTYNDVLIFQAFYESAGVEDIYFRVTDISVTRLGPAGTSRDTTSPYLIAVTFVEVDRPATIGAAVTVESWQDVLNTFTALPFTDWNDVLSSRSNWLDLLNRPLP